MAFHGGVELLVGDVTFHSMLLNKGFGSHVLRLSVWDIGVACRSV